MRGFVVYPTYRTENNQSFVYLFGRLENNESFLTINKYNPYFYIKEEDVDKAKNIAKHFEFEVFFLKTDFKNFDGNFVSKVEVNNTKDLVEARKKFTEEDIICYEADIRYVYRFMIDKGIKGAINIEGEYKKENGIGRVYYEPNISGFDSTGFMPKLKILSIDIETESKNFDKIYSIAIVGDGLKKCLIVHDKNVEGAVCFRNEKDMLAEFSSIISEFDPDIITGWNLIDFDLKKIESKFREYKLPFKLGRLDWPCKLNVKNDFMLDSTANFPGRMVLDAIHMLKYSFVRIEDYKLETAAISILGEGKVHVDSLNKGEQIDYFYKNEPEKLVEYNLNDAELVLKILKKLNIVELTVERSLLTGMQLDRVKATIASLDSLYLRKARERKIVCPSVYNYEKENPGVGGFVMEPVPGIFDYVIVLDFKSMYPSIIRTFNIDPYTLRDHGDIVAPNGARFIREKGILPEIIEGLWSARDRAKKRNDNIASYTIKITMNGFYGSLSNPTCRFHSMLLANSITSFAQYFIKRTASLLKEKGYPVIYGDTDSIFVDLSVKKEQEAISKGLELQKFINDYYEEHIKKEYGCDSKLFIEFAKVYKVFVMPQIRGVQQGAKKRYAGLLVTDRGEEIDIVGMEFVRTDWTMLARNFQYNLFDLIFHKKPYEDFIKKFIDDLKKGKFDDLLVYKKSITKPLEEYTKTTPPHVKAARKKGALTSRIISYIMTVDGPEPSDSVKHKIDYEHYIEKQIKPIADSILVFFNKKFDDIVKGHKQTKLSGF